MNRGRMAPLCSAVLQQAVPGSVDPQPRDRSTEFVQVYKFWCYYWGLCLLTEPSGARGGPFELLFLPLSFSAPSCSRAVVPTRSLSLSPPSPLLLYTLSYHYLLSLCLPPLPPLSRLLHPPPSLPPPPCGSPFNSPALPFRVPILHLAADPYTAPETCLFSLRVVFRLLNAP